ncbi:ABC transporter permease [Dyella flava]|uniref:ABC transporter permease n=2 Tax=Dyella flava TaxID=1920170 RepID=A0ABS2K673_9GAMM|nr:FtsX-like permease family protein [Dyella flava]MBM7126697.1 ABC transporter permease [Dyella flava]
MLQIALTLGVVCNALFVVGQRLDRMHRATGIDEANLLLINTSHTGLKTNTDASRSQLDASIQGDLQALRKLPDVADAYESNSMPLARFGEGLGLRKTADKHGDINGLIFYVDEHAIPTLGLKLIAGRNFRADEIGAHSLLGVVEPPVIIITQHMANELFPAGDALGKQVYMTSSTRPSTIIGIIGHMESNAPHANDEDYVWNCMLLPYRMTASQRIYVIRARPGRLQAATQSVPTALIAQDPLRVIPDGYGDEAGGRTFAQVRADTFRSDRAVLQFMLVISVILLAVTGAGIVGLTSFWVGQRRKQIGVRRALGATQHGILLYFLTENIFISSCGVILGVAMAIGFNLWMETQFEMHRLPLPYIAWGVVALLVLGQAAVLGPALRASKVSPMEATRSV